MSEARGSVEEEKNNRFRIFGVNKRFFISIEKSIKTGRNLRVRSIGLEDQCYMRCWDKNVLEDIYLRIARNWHLLIDSSSIILMTVRENHIRKLSSTRSKSLILFLKLIFNRWMRRLFFYPPIRISLFFKTCHSFFLRFLYDASIKLFPTSPIDRNRGENKTAIAQCFKVTWNAALIHGLSSVLRLGVSLSMLVSRRSKFDYIAIFSSSLCALLLLPARILAVWNPVTIANRIQI